MSIILITGSSGLVGSESVNFFSDRGFDVIGIDNDLRKLFFGKLASTIPIKNNFNLYFKNLNSLGKNVDKYKSSPQIELQYLFEINSELPMIKKVGNFNEILMPKLMT